MKQIKTISYKLDHAAGFDDKVNEAIREGWKLTKREVLIPKAQSETLYTYIMLYAELEQEIITEREPCCSCVDGEVAPTKWEEAET